MNRSKFQNVLPYLPTVALVMSAVLFFLFPISGDDWNRVAMVHVNLSDYLVSAYDSWYKLNGRILGNVFSMMWIGHVWRILIRLVCVIGIWQFVHLIFRIRKSVALLFTLTTIFLLPKEVLREVWVWNAGFYNYVPPLVLLLLLFQVYSSTDMKPLHRNLLLFLTSFSVCLFMENITVYVVILALFLTAVHLWKERGLRHVWPLLLGAVLGALLMFSSPVYWRIANDADGYRSATESLLDNWGTIARYMVASNLLFLIASTGFFLWTSLQRKSMRWAAVLYTAIAIVISLWPMFEIDEEALWINLWLHFAFYALMMLLGWKLLQGNSRRLFIAIILSIGLLVGQLLFVSPVGARNFFTPALFHMLLLLLMYRSLSASAPLIQKQAGVMLLLFLFAKLFYLIPIYTANYTTFVQRIERVQTAIQADRMHVEIPAYPYPEHVHDPGAEKMGNVLFKNERGDVEIVVEE